MLVVDVPEEQQGIVMEHLGKKKAEMKHMVHSDNGRVRIEFEVPSRGLLGFRSQFLTDTRGMGIATFSFAGYQPYKGDILTRTKGALVSMEKGSTTGFALDALQARGVLFIGPGERVYEGMIIGENSRDMDMDVNPCKQKKLTNMRASGTDEAIRLEPPRRMDLETCMEWIQPDELIEITPHQCSFKEKDSTSRFAKITMAFYRMVLAYDGTSYHGWQRQRSVPTIAGELERSFKEVFNKDITIVGASRTDAGVHALGQVARFFLEDPLPERRMKFAWNNILPPAILIRSLTETSDAFHPQRGVIQKVYQYHIFEKRPLPLYARYGYFSGKLDREKLGAGLQFFVGTHDYRSFCTGHEAESTIRSICSIDVVPLPRYGALRVTVIGPGFLRYMIRRIVGACIDIASSPSRSITELSSALEERDPCQNLHVAPSCGLVLRSIEYKGETADALMDDDYTGLIYDGE